MSSFGKMMYGTQKRTSESTVGVRDSDYCNEDSVDKLKTVRCRFEFSYSTLETYLQNVLRTMRGARWLQSKFGQVPTDNLADVFRLNSFKLTDILEIKLNGVTFNLDGNLIPLQFYKSKTYINVNDDYVTMDLVGSKAQWQQCEEYMCQHGRPIFNFTLLDFKSTDVKVEDISVDFRFVYNGLNIQFPLKHIEAEFQSYAHRQLNLPVAYTSRADMELLGKQKDVTNVTEEGVSATSEVEGITSGMGSTGASTNFFGS